MKKRNIFFIAMIILGICGMLANPEKKSNSNSPNGTQNNLRIDSPNRGIRTIAGQTVTYDKTDFEKNQAKE